jgi:hypothetical protein
MPAAPSNLLDARRALTRKGQPWQRDGDARQASAVARVSDERIATRIVAA